MTTSPTPDIDPLDALTDASVTSVASKEKPTQMELLVKLAREELDELFHSPRGEPYATVTVSGMQRTLRVDDTQLESWLTVLAYNRWKKPPSSSAVRNAIDMLAALAKIEGEEHTVYVRTAPAPDALSGTILNLASAEGTVVHLTSNGWVVLPTSPVRFRTVEAVRALPPPVSGGNIRELLRPFANVEDDDAMVLLTTVLVAYLYHAGPYPVLCIQGVQGSAKTTLSRMVRKLIDPSVVELRRLPTDTRDFMIAAELNHVLAFDNLSGMRQETSDVICTLATGAGFATRTLYANSSETLFAACRPIILNGIDAGATRGDLLDRAVMLHLPAIAGTNRRTEAEYWAAFDEAHPHILGALLDALAAGIANLDSVDLDELPRMADFARLAVASEAALGWPPGTFMRVYTQNRRSAITRTLEADALATTLRSLVQDRTAPIVMTPGDLLQALDGRCPTCATDRTWPRSADALGKRINRIMPLLNESGWLTIQRSRGDQRHIIVEPIHKTSDGSDARDGTSPAGGAS